MTAGSPLCARVAPWLLLPLFLFHAVAVVVYLQREDLPPSWDPAYHLSIALRYYDALVERGVEGLVWWHTLNNYYPPLFHALCSLAFWFAPPSEDAACLVNLLFLAVLLASTYGVGRDLYDWRVGLTAAVLVSCYPLALSMFKLLYIDGALLAMTTLVWWLAVACRHFTRPLSSWALGAACGLGMLTKWTFAFFAVVPLLYAVLPVLLPAVARLPERPDPRAAALRSLWLLVSMVGSALLAWRMRPLAMAAPHLTALLLGAALLVIGALPALARVWGWALRWPRGDDWGPPRRMAGALLMAFVLAMWWYGPRAALIVRDTVTNAYPGGHPVSWQPWTLLEYLWLMQFDQLHFVAGVVFLYGVWWAIVAFRRHRDARGVLLLAGVAAPYVMFSLLSLRNPRFTLPYLGVIAVLSAAALCAIPWQPARRAVLTLVIGWSLFYAVLLSYGPPRGWPDYIGWELRVWDVWEGDIALWRMWTPASPADWGQDWKTREIIAAIAASTPPRERPARVGLLVDHSALHYEALNVLARLDGIDLDADLASRRDGDIETAATFRLLLTKSGDRGIEAERFAAATTELEGATGALHPRYRLLRSFPLPDGEAARLWAALDHETGM